MIFTARFLVVPALASVLVAGGGALAVAYAGDEEPSPPTSPRRDDTQACAMAADFTKKQTNLFDVAPIGVMAEQMQDAAAKVGGRLGVFKLNDARVDVANVFVVEASDGTVLLFDYRGKRIAVGAHVRVDGSLTWFESLGMYELRCK